MLQRLVERLREAEIVRASEILSAAIDSAGGEQLFSSDHSELLAELVADEILSAVAARQRQIRRLDMAGLRRATR